LELSLNQITRLVADLKYLGCEAITITGGGEPLMHPDIEDIIGVCHSAGIEVGLVSNGYLLARLSSKTLSQITWCRISCNDKHILESNLLNSITYAVKKGPAVDWAFSYVVTRDFKLSTLSKYIEYANENNFTHIRIVSDLLDLENVIPMTDVKNVVLGSNLDDSRAIYQGRKSYSPGQKECLISLLKPNIGADGKIYPCCGAQYALEEPTFDYSEQMSMGSIEDIREIYEKQANFDGSVCARCYYTNYNDALSMLKSEVNHERFV